MDSNNTAIDEDGLPLVYDKDLIQAYWSKEKGALQQRWRVFAGKAVPFLTKMLTLFIRDGSIKEEEIPALSRQARMDLQDLGPTFISTLSLGGLCRLAAIRFSFNLQSLLPCFLFFTRTPQSWDKCSVSDRMCCHSPHWKN